ncbi:MAG TPA: HAD family hydrolase [Polyangia bacterium]|nr:HAD family hydrolase [Polyangia bacterium]
MPRGIIFDVDGTLVDSNDAHTHAWVAACQEIGFPVLFRAVRSLIGMGGDKLIPALLGIDSQSPAGRRLAELRREIFLGRHLPAVRPFADTRALVQALRDDGVGVAIASSAKAAELDALLDVAQVRDLVSHVTSADDAEASKPDPDVVVAALRRLGLPAEDVLMVGDTPYDGEAARRAGVGFVAVRCGGWWDDASLSPAAAIFDNPADMLANRTFLPWRPLASR